LFINRPPAQHYTTSHIVIAAPIFIAFRTVAHPPPAALRDRRTRSTPESSTRTATFAETAMEYLDG
jgi:hypothetical protein